MVHLANQITPYTCGLACVESVATDFRKPVTQHQLLAALKEPLIEEAKNEPETFGQTSDFFLCKIFKAAGFQTEIHVDHVKEKMRERFARVSSHYAVVIVMIRPSGKHVVRVISVAPLEDKVTVMEPRFGQPLPEINTYWFDELISWQFRDINVSRVA